MLRWRWNVWSHVYPSSATSAYQPASNRAGRFASGSFDGVNPALSDRPNVITAKKPTSRTAGRVATNARIAGPRSGRETMEEYTPRARASAVGRGHSTCRTISSDAAAYRNTIGERSEMTTSKRR